MARYGDEPGDERRDEERRQCYEHKIGRAASSREVASDLMSLALNSAVRSFSRVSIPS